MGAARRKALWLATAGIAFSMPVALGPVASAETHFVVDSTTDAKDAAPGDGICATTSGQCTLRAAVNEANAAPDANTISLEAPAPATYALSLAGQGEDSASIGDLDLTQDVTIAGRGPESDVVSGASIDRVFHVVGAGSSVTIRGMTITKGTVTSEAGGGVLNEGELHLDDVLVKGNNSANGGGISSKGLLMVSGASIESNYSSGQGGGMSITSPASTPASNTVLSLVDSELRSNIAASVGGGLVVAVSPPLRYDVVRSSVIGNGANAGGGLWNNVPESNTSSVIRDSTIATNSVSDTSCGGGTGTPPPPPPGAAVGGTQSCSAVAEGGGIVNVGTLTLLNDTVVLNTANKGGGGIANGTDAFAGRTVVANTVIADNSNGTIADNCAHGALTSLGGNIDDTVNDCGLDSDLGNPDSDGDRTGVDPGLGPIESDPFGRTTFYPPLETGPAVDGGLDVVCTSEDQLGQPRPADGDGDSIARCDVGAIELHDTPKECDRFGSVCGTAGDDEIEGTDGDDFLVGGDGDDHIVCGGGNDTVYAGDGNDVIECGDGDDILYGGPGADILVGGRGDDEFFSGGGDDQMFGDFQQPPGSPHITYFARGEGKDKMRGEGGNDFAFGGGAFDRLLGGGGRDRLWGGPGDDSVDGSDGEDKLYGQDGEDELDGGKGADELRAGDGRDICVVGDLDTVVQSCDQKKRAHKRAH
jgi:CSLREA domain-containing protein